MEHPIAKHISSIRPPNLEDLTKTQQRNKLCDCSVTICLLSFTIHLYITAKVPLDSFSSSLLKAPAAERSWHAKLLALASVLALPLTILQRWNTQGPVKFELSFPLSFFGIEIKQMDL
jgi:hypothetical protein